MSSIRFPIVRVIGIEGLFTIMASRRCPPERGCVDHPTGDSEKDFRESRQ